MKIKRAQFDVTHYKHSFTKTNQEVNAKLKKLGILPESIISIYDTIQTRRDYSVSCSSEGDYTVRLIEVWYRQ